MDLQQRKLNKSEWDSIEIPVSQSELEVLKLIQKGSENVNIKYNKTNSLLSFLKIEYNEIMEDYLYNKYFSEKINAFLKLYNININVNMKSNPQIKKIDSIRLQKNSSDIIENAGIYEFILIEMIEKILHNKNNPAMEKYYYTLFKLLDTSISNLNRHVVGISNKVLELYADIFNYETLIIHARDCIEQNTYLLKYSDMMLYEHQKQLFTFCKNNNPKLILYIAPTGTGKTLSPLGLAENEKRIIFVCAARHVGLALAKSALSLGKKIAFAFGCDTAKDIRLHNNAAVDGIRDWKSGAIRKPNHDLGDKVEIMICDIKSYLPAMYYMMAFNLKEDITTYWDEPTITMDYNEHEFHELIHKNWSNNEIPNLILSSATLPKMHELGETIADFKFKFKQSIVYNIVSHDCKKTIPLVNKNGFVVLPHLLYENYEKLLEVVAHCEENLTLLRYFDLRGVVLFIDYLLRYDTQISETLKIKHNITCLNDINTINIKLYYLKLLKNIKKNDWKILYSLLKSKNQQRITPNEYIDPKGQKIKKAISVGPGINMVGHDKKNGVPLIRMMSTQESTTISKITTQNEENTLDGCCALYITTKDAYTLTDGPTLFLAEDVEKMAKFCLQQAQIPIQVIDDIMEKINYNNAINIKIGELENEIEDTNNMAIQNDCVSKMKNNGLFKNGSGGKIKTKEKTHKIAKMSGDDYEDRNTKKLKTDLEMLRSLIKISKLNDTFVPNTQEHLNKWVENTQKNKPFKCDINDETIVKIMMLNDVEPTWKILLLMGIGVFTNHKSIEYTEIMKNLADQQKLYLIIASSDYIYGTNYQFCHGYISKDMNLTQEKIIQALGRIGRNNIQQEYTIRFRDDNQILKIFGTEEEKPEVHNMNKLFSGSS
jgi:hypothetical protein